MTTLILYIDNKELKEFYETKAKEHNIKVSTDPHPDSGFNLYCVNDILCSRDYELPFKTFKVDFHVKGVMYKECKLNSVAYTLHPRSSISNTPFRLANNTGIIDSGYRGNLIVKLDCYKPNAIIEKYKSYIQICQANLEPFKVIVKYGDEIDATERGENGFGSTGV